MPAAMLTRNLVALKGHCQVLVLKQASKTIATTPLATTPASLPLPIVSCQSQPASQDRTSSPSKGRHFFSSFTSVCRGENVPQKTPPGPSPLIKQIIDRIGTNKIEQINGFKLFKVEQKFIIDTKSLRRELRLLQKLLHPDKFVTASESLKDQSHILSALINDFFNILMNPYERGRYLLSLESGEPAEVIEKKLENIKLEDEFLERMMDIGTRVYSQLNDLPELNKLYDELSHDYNNLMRQLEQSFDARDYETVIQLLARMKFVGKNHHAVAQLFE